MRGSADAAMTSVEVQLGAELLYNVSILTNMYETKVRSASHFLQTSTKKLESLQSDLEQIQERRKLGKERKVKMILVLEVVNRISGLFVGNGGGKDLRSKVEILVQNLRDELNERDKMMLQFDKFLVPSLLSPLINNTLHSWEPLHDDTRKTKHIMDSLMDLGYGGMSNAEVERERKEYIFKNDILPKVNTSFESTRWNPILDVENAIALYQTISESAEKHCSSMKHHGIIEDNDVSPFIDSDNDLRTIVSREVLKGTILPKLLRVLNQWKAELDNSYEIPRILNHINSWLLPWMPYLNHPELLLQITPDLRSKIRSALSCMNRGIVNNDTDFLRLSIATLLPWRMVLKKETIYDLTSRYITPRLMKALSQTTVVLNVEKQDWQIVDVLLNVYNLNLMERIEFLSLIEGEILSMWIHGLQKLVSSCEGSKQDIEKAAYYYKIWKLK